MGIRSSRALLPRIEVGSRTMKGKRPTNEDTVLIEFDPMANEALFGVFDGHNGAECAQYLQSHYPGVLRAQEDFVDGSSGQVEEALKRAAAAVDATYLKQAKREQWQAGSTATLAYWRDGEVWFSQTGDSRAIIVKDGEATKITNVHAIENPDELARIEASGALIQNGRLGGQLNMSRAFGDPNLKQQNFLISDPEITYHRLWDDQHYIVLATDGLWDFVSSARVARYIARFQRYYTASELAIGLADMAYERGSTDNITVVVLKVNEKRKCVPKDKSRSDSDDNKDEPAEAPR